MEADPVPWMLTMRSKHCPPTSFLASQRCNRSLAMAYRDPGLSGVLLHRPPGDFSTIYMFEDSEADEVSAPSVTTVSTNFNDFACSLLNEPPSREMACLCDSLLFIDCLLAVENGKMTEGGEGEAELRLVLANGGQQRLGRVLGWLLHHCCPLVVLRLARTSPRPQVKAQYGEVVEEGDCGGSDVLLAYRRVSSLSKTVEADRAKAGLVAVQSQQQFSRVLALGGRARRRLQRIVRGSQVGRDPVDQATLWAVVERMVQAGASDGDIYAELYRVYHQEIRVKWEKAAAAAKAAKEAEAADDDEAEDEGFSDDEAGDAGAATGGDTCSCGSGGTGTSERAAARIEHIRVTLPEGFRPDSVLDVGCADGSITVALGYAFGVPREQTHGCDVRELAGGQQQEENFSFTLLRGAQCRGGYLPYPAERFSLITMIMTLHHLEDQEEAVWEAERLLKPGGVLVIREHQCDEFGLDMVLDIMHGLYALVWQPQPESPNFISEYFAHYRPRDGRDSWDMMMHDAGLRRVHTAAGNKYYRYADPKPRSKFDIIDVNPSKVYYAAYQKPTREEAEERRRAKESAAEEARGGSIPRAGEERAGAEAAPTRKRSRSRSGGSSDSSSGEEEEGEGVERKKKRKHKKEKRKHKKEKKSKKEKKEKSKKEKKKEK